MDDAIDQRQYPRVTFFLVPVNREQVPVWLFKPVHDLRAIAGLILNVSAGGMQVMTSPEAAMQHPAYALQLLDADESGNRLTTRVRRVWTRPLSSFGTVNGLAFEDTDGPAAKHVLRQAPGEREWLRCLLLPDKAPGTAADQAA